MTEKDIKGYLKDNTQYSDQVINAITPQILKSLNYESIYYQIDVLAYQLTTD